MAHADPVRGKKGKGRKALKQNESSTSEANILAATDAVLLTVPPPSDGAEKENHESLSQPKKTKGKASSKAKQQLSESFEKDLQDMQEKLQQLRIEKEKTEDLLKQREDELESRFREHEKLQVEFKKLQKLKEFKPTVTFPIGPSVRDQEQEKKQKKGCPEKKRPSLPYILWSKDQWNEVKKENPEAGFKEISNILGAKWKSVTAEEKKPYEERYQAEKEAYLQIVGKEKRENEAMKLLEDEQKQKTAMELLEQYLQFKEEAGKENKKTKKEKDPLKPKQPMSAYFSFSNERRVALSSDENKSIVEVAKITGEEWKNMTDKQKEPYEKMAKKNKEKFLEEMEVYKQKKDEEAENHKKEEDELKKIQKQEALQLLKKKEKTENIIKKTKENQQKKKRQQKEEKSVDPNKPKKPASSFILFSKEARKTLSQERPGINNSALNVLISVKWKELKEEERQVWNSRAAEAMEAYKEELEAYVKSKA